VFASGEVGDHFLLVTRFSHCYLIIQGYA